MPFNITPVTVNTMLYNFIVSASHVPGKTNSIADAESHNQVEKFFRLAPRACHQPTETPGEVLRSLMPYSTTTNSWH